MEIIDSRSVERIRSLKVKYTLRHCKVIRVYDGDSFWVQFSMPDRFAIFRQMEVRVAGIDCPELSDSRPEIRNLALQARDLTVKCFEKSKYYVDLELVEWDKYARLNADVKFYQNTSATRREKLTLSQVLIAAKLARPYTGEGPRPW